MALLVNKLPQAVAGIMAGIDEGIEDVLSDVTARPPEKVSFYIDAITNLNSLERNKIKITEPSIKTIISTNIIETISINGSSKGLDGAFAVSTNTNVETSSERFSTSKSWEDQSINAFFEYPGPKSS